MKIIKICAKGPVYCFFVKMSEKHSGLAQFKPPFQTLFNIKPYKLLKFIV